MGDDLKKCWEPPEQGSETGKGEKFNSIITSKLNMVARWALGANLEHTAQPCSSWGTRELRDKGAGVLGHHLPQLGLNAAPNRCKCSRISSQPPGTSRAASGCRRKPTGKDTFLLALEVYWRTPPCWEPRAWGGSQGLLTVDSINTSWYSTLYFDDPKGQGGLLYCLNHDLPEWSVKIVGCAS